MLSTMENAKRRKKLGMADLALAPEKSEKITGSARVYAQLRDEILRLELAPGSPIDENSLSERFDLSRSPVREALVRLSSEGFVNILPNRSTIVAPIDFRDVPKYLDSLDLLQRATTRLAAQFRTNADLRTIEKRQIDFEKAFHRSVKTRDPLHNIDANFNFHMAIAEAGKNAYFQMFYKRLLDEGRRMLHFHFEFQALSEHMTFEEVAVHHVQMIEAIKSKDLEYADAVAHEHAMQFKGRFLEYYDQSVTAKMKLAPSS